MNLEHDRPSIYHVRPTVKGLSIEVFEAIKPNTESFREQPIDLRQNALGLPEAFIYPSDNHEYFGFGPVLTQTEHTKPDWITYACTFPVAKSERKTTADWDNFYATTATLKVVFDYLHQQPSNIGSSIPQLMTADISNDRERHGNYGNPLRVSIQPALVHWLDEHMDRAEEISNNMSQAMQTLYTHMEPTLSDSVIPWDFQVRITRPTQLTLDCPGNGAGLDPGTRRIKDGNGFTLYTHNGDTPIQQLTLLTGIAKLNEMAKDDL